MARDRGLIGGMISFLVIAAAAVIAVSLVLCIPVGIAYLVIRLKEWHSSRRLTSQLKELVRLLNETLNFARENPDSPGIAEMIQALRRQLDSCQRTAKNRERHLHTA